MTQYLGVPSFFPRDERFITLFESAVVQEQEDFLVQTCPTTVLAVSDNNTHNVIITAPIRTERHNQMNGGIT